MHEGLLPRLGTFLILVGLGLMVLFFGSMAGRDMNLGYLFSSTAALFLGIVLRRRVPHAESNRFGTIRRINEKKRQRREEKQRKASQNQ